jgi:hypothetical protein
MRETKQEGRMEQSIWKLGGPKDIKPFLFIGNPMKMAERATIDNAGWND